MFFGNEGVGEGENDRDSLLLHREISRPGGSSATIRGDAAPGNASIGTDLGKWVAEAGEPG